MKKENQLIREIVNEIRQERSMYLPQASVFQYQFLALSLWEEHEPFRSGVAQWHSPPIPAQALSPDQWNRMVRLLEHAVRVLRRLDGLIWIRLLQLLAYLLLWFCELYERRSEGDERDNEVAEPGGRY